MSAEAHEKQSDRTTGFLGKSLGYQTIWHVQQAQIKPPALKLLLLNIAIHVNSETGLAFPSIGLLAVECSLSLSHTKRLLKIARDAEILVVASHGGGKSSNRYRFNLEVLLRGYTAPADSIPEAVLKELRTSLAKTSSAMIPAQGAAVTLPALEPPACSTMSKEPHGPQRPQSLGGGGRPTPAGSASPPPWVVPELPPELDPHLFAQLVGMGSHKQPRIDALAKEAFELVAAGQDINALATNTLKLDLKSWCKPPRANSHKQRGAGHKPPSPETDNPTAKQWGGY
jgi:hypothetical protein